MGPDRRLVELLSGQWVTHAIACVARLSVADHLVDGPRTVADLAERCGVHEPSLRRLLRALSSVEIFNESEAGVFELTPTARLLRADVRGSLRPLAMMLGSSWQARTYCQLVYAITSGRSAFKHIHGCSPFDWFAENDLAGATFDDAMAGHAAYLHASFADACDLTGARTIVDVGGGHGELLRAVLDRTPGASGVLFDLAPVIARARAIGLHERITPVAGDFLRSVPDGDTYLVCSVLQHYEDEAATTLLVNIRDRIASDGRVVIGEAMRRVDPPASFTDWLDLEMLVVFGGLVRTQAEHRRLLEATAFQPTEIVTTETGDVTVIEARPR